LEILFATFIGSLFVLYDNMILLMAFIHKIVIGCMLNYYSHVKT